MIFATAVLCLVASATSEPASPAPGFACDARGGGRDEAALGNVCELAALRTVLAKPDSVWVVGRVDPAPESPRTLGRGLGPVLAEYFGSCRVDATIAGPRADGIDGFSLKMNLPYFGGGPGLDFDPLKEVGGAIVASVGQVSAGKAVLGDVVVIPDEWRGQVGGAIDRLRKEPKLIGDRPVGPDLDLRSLLKEQNPFIAVAAFRNLARAGAAPSTLAEAFTVPDPVRHAAYTRILLNLATPDANPYAGLLKDQVVAATDTKTLRPIALAIYEVVNVSGSSSATASAEELGTLVLERNASLTGKTDRYLDMLLRGPRNNPK